MLPRTARLTRGQDFSRVVRKGRRAGRPRLVVHVLWPMYPVGPRDTSERDAPPTRNGIDPTRVGFVVSKAVGSAVVRHRVTRKLRHLVRDRLPLLPDGGGVVIRALRPAAGASSDQLAADLDSALRRLGLLDGESVDQQRRTARSG